LISTGLILGLQKAKVFKKVALTSGDWEVLARSVWVDEEHDLVFFMGMRESPLEKHLYAVSLLRPGEFRLLTRPGYSYCIDMNKVHNRTNLIKARC
jgi:dipeptidyl-peptidase 9